MWFTAEVLARLRVGLPVNANEAEIELAKRKRKAEEDTESSGRGVCLFCDQEIVKNELLKVWESDFLVGYCPSSKDGKHKPVVRWE